MFAQTFRKTVVLLFSFVSEWELGRLYMIYNGELNSCSLYTPSLPGRGPHIVPIDRQQPN